MNNRQRSYRKNAELVRVLLQIFVLTLQLLTLAVQLFLLLGSVTSIGLVGDGTKQTEANRSLGASSLNDPLTPSGPRSHCHSRNDPTFC